MVMRIGRDLLRKCPQCARQFLRNYNAAVLETIGEPLVIKDKGASPKPSANEVLVDVQSAGVNHNDWMMVSGLHHARVPKDGIPGYEFSGEVKAVGSSVKGFAEGDRVVGLKTKAAGAFAQECLVNQKELYKIPYSLSYELAASIPVPYLTAMLALRNAIKVKEGETVLVISSRGSTGLAAVDLAINVHHYNVITASESEDKCALMRPKGVLATIEYQREDLVKGVLKHTQGKGVDLVIDTVGGNLFQQALECVRPLGKICPLGFSSGAIPTVSLQDINKHQVVLTGTWLGGFALLYPEKFHDMMEDIIQMLDEQYIEPLVATRFTLEQVNEALQHVADTSTMGKTVLTIKD